MHLAAQQQVAIACRRCTGACLALLLILATLVPLPGSAAANTGGPASGEQASATAADSHRMAAIIGGVIGIGGVLAGAAWLAALRRRTVRTEAASKSAARMLAYASHEVRNPVHGIVGLAEMLERSPLDAEQRRIVATIRETALGLGRLADDFLQHARLNLGELPPRPAAIAPADLVGSVIALERPLAERKRIRLESRIGAEVPGFVLVDATRLRQVLLNLVGNAIRHSASGDISIRVSPVAAQTGRLRFEVRDSGRGLGPAERERLFQPFAHDTGTARPADAVGIGLWISKQMIESVGGSIGIDAQTLRGSCFWFEVDAPACPAPTPEIALPDQPLPRLTVFVVDDDPVSLEVTLAQLAHLGVDARGSSDPIEVTGALAGNTCDLVLLDYDMPGLDGLALARRVHGRGPDAASRPRLVILSGTDRARLGDAGLDTPVDDWLLKPVSIDELAAALRRLFGSGPGVVAEPAPGPATKTLILDDSAIAELARLRIEGRPADAVLAARVLRALDRQLDPLAVAVDSGDRPLAARLAHRLRGTVAPLGCVALAQALGQLEAHSRDADRGWDATALADVRTAAAATRAALDARYGASTAADNSALAGADPAHRGEAPD